MTTGRNDWTRAFVVLRHTVARLNSSRVLSSPSGRMSEAANSMCLRSDSPALVRLSSFVSSSRPRLSSDGGWGLGAPVLVSVLLPRFPTVVSPVELRARSTATLSSPLESLYVCVGCTFVASSPSQLLDFRREPACLQASTKGPFDCSVSTFQCDCWPSHLLQGARYIARQLPHWLLSARRSALPVGSAFVRRWTWAAD